MQKGNKAGADASAVEFLGKGRAAIKSRCLEDALRHFSKGLEADPSDELKSCLLAARAEVFIERGLYGSALADCKEVGKLDGGVGDTLYRQGVCEDALGLHRRAVESLERACGSSEPAKVAWQKALETARKHVQEQLGNYDWTTLHATPRVDDGVPSSLGVTSFCHSIEIKCVAGHGRALVLTHDVAEGDLLFVSKAFVLALQTDLRRTVLDKLATCPQVDYDRFFCLYDGSNKDQIVPPSLNLEGRALDFSPGENGSRRAVNAKHVDKILRFNTFAHDSLNEFGAAEASPVSGIWFLPTFLNHSCRPNVQRTFLGDVMICRAAHDMKAGTELCDTYVSPFQPIHVRRDGLKADLDFECRCCRCVLEEAFLSKDDAEPFLLKLDAIVKEIDPSDLTPSSDALDQLTSSIERKVNDVVEAGKKKLETDARLKQACCTLWGDALPSSSLTESLKRLLCGSFLSVFKGAAFARKQLCQPGKCADAYRRCLELLEEVSRSSAYHAHWAAQCALQTYQADRLAGNEIVSELVKASVHAARRWNVNCHGSAAFRFLMKQQGWPEELCVVADAFATSGETALDYSLEELNGAALVLSLALPDGVEPTELDLDVGEQRVRVCCHSAIVGSSQPLVIELPKVVDPDRAPAAKFKKKGGRRLVLELPLQEASG